MADNIYQVDTTIDLNDCFLWQYDKATRLKYLLQAKQSWYNTNITGFWNDFLTNIFNINTANTFGINLWGKFLNVPRPSYVQDGQTITFTDDQYRLLIKGQLLLMNSNGSLASINDYLNYLFPNKAAFVIPYTTMAIRLVFYYNPTPDELAIIQATNFLPRPAGVEVDYVIFPADEIFGFDNTEMANFDNGSFFA